jgi:hypothetical protein
MTFNLNRISFFDNQTNFPREVLRALVYTCGVSVTNQQIISRERDIINFVKNFKREVNADFDKIEDNNGLIKIADYIGSQSGWKDKDNLIKALKNIIIFNDSLDIETLIEKTGGLKLSFKNNDNIYSCDIIMAYKYCLVKNINIEKEDTSEIIVQKIIDYLKKDKRDKEIEDELTRISEEKEVKLKETEEKVMDEERKIEEEKLKIEEEKLKEERKIEEEKLKIEEERKIRNRLNFENEVRLRELEEKIKREHEEKHNFIENKYVNQIKEIEKEVENLKEKHHQELFLVRSETQRLDKEKSLKVDVSTITDPLNISSERKNNLDLNLQKISHQNISGFLKVIPKVNYNLEDIEKFLKTSLSNLLISRTLLTNEEAIFIGLRVFFFDLRSSTEPFEDLLKLNECRKDDKNFIADRDEIFSKNLKLNKNYYYIDHYYRKDLKPFYTQKIFNILFEEYSVKSIESLEEYYEKDNFHRGWLGGTVSSYSNHNNFLSFGRLGVKVVSFEVQELINYFKTHGSKNIIDNTDLSQEQIEGLKMICAKFPKDEGYNNLLNSLEKRTLEDDTDLQFVLSKYLFASETINKTLDDMFRIGMFIRGWRLSGCNSAMVYPLQKKDCVDFLSRHEEIIEKVNKVKSDLKYHLEKLNIAIRNSLKKLPLVDYIGGEFVYSVSGNKISNLLEELEDLKPSNYKNVSNQIILVAYYYTFVTSNKKLYPIESLELL